MSQLILGVNRFLVVKKCGKKKSLVKTISLGQKGSKIIGLKQFWVKNNFAKKNVLEKTYVQGILRS